jgi:hypothetical protein
MCGKRIWAAEAASKGLGTEGCRIKKAGYLAFFIGGWRGAVVIFVGLYDKCPAACQMTKSD